MAEAAANFKYFRVGLEGDPLAASVVALHGGNRTQVDDGGAVNLPKLLGVELRNQLADRRADK
jgi:hypothetical protein